jgi:hypothetical protein
VTWVLIIIVLADMPAIQAIDSFTEADCNAARKAVIEAVWNDQRRKVGIQAVCVRR